MRLPSPRAVVASSCLALALLAAGCQKAGPYKARSAEKADKAEAAPKPESLPADYVWELGRGGDDVRLEFVHQGTQPKEWAELKAFWTDTRLTRAAAALAVSGLAAAPVASGPPVVKIKVPLGLDDPLAYIPHANPPTVRKWELGRRLFFDDGWLAAKPGQSCARCHDPGRGYTDGRREAGGLNTPTLINGVYNGHQFWDGRATYLEDVVQARLEDEREPESGPFRHVWGGAIKRLRDSESYRTPFEAAFGTAPTQVAVGRALATYLRTLLAADSLHDRAVQAAKGRPLEEGHYAAVLDEAALKALGREKAVKAGVAGELFLGYTLFRGKAGCAGCHTPGNGVFTDHAFHNIGVGADDYTGDNSGQRPGRFAVAPPGEKNRHLIGAYKTPTLRSLSRTAPYFHNGGQKDLAGAVRFHVRPAPFNRYLDPSLADKNGEHRDFGLTDSEVDRLVQFLRALNGGEVDPFVRAKPAAK
jgi:cytochrome c peroxidase